MDKLRLLFAILGGYAVALMPLSLRAAPPGSAAAGMYPGAVYGGSPQMGTGAAQAAPANLGSVGVRQAAPATAAPAVSAGAYIVRSGAAYPAVSRSVNSVQASAASTVRGQIAPQQGAAAASARNLYNGPVRQIAVPSSNRTDTALRAFPQRTDTPAVAARMPGRVYNPGLYYNQLSPADLVRVAADRRNARTSPNAGAAVASASDYNRTGGRFHDERRYPRFGFRYSNVFSSGYYGNSYGSYAYPSIYVFQSYGYPFSAVSPIFNPYPPAYYYSETPSPDETDPGMTEPAPDPQQQPPAPDTRSAPTTQQDNQPDSLVQDVQRELANRGYFNGRLDGLVTAAFQEALRRFQNDQRLNVTGLLNQATLYALGLN